MQKSLTNYESFVVFFFWTINFLIKAFSLCLFTWKSFLFSKILEGMLDWVSNLIFKFPEVCCMYINIFDVYYMNMWFLCNVLCDVYTKYYEYVLCGNIGWS